MLKTNKDRLPIVAVQGQVWHSRWASPGKMSTEGMIYCLQGTGGITYNAQIGDICTGWAADHLEPGVTTRNPDDPSNNAYNTYSCIGNEATVKSGDAKGGRGFVTGKHGGVEHVIVYFPYDVLEKLSIDDKIGIKATGQGLALLDHPEVVLRNMSPALLEKMNIVESQGKLNIGVAKTVPAALMGSGLGTHTTASGDYDISMHDPKANQQYKLHDLRFGDIVAITDADTRYGRTYYGGAVTIGVVVHADCISGGHGPGVTTLMSSKEPVIVPFIDSSANLADMFLKKP